jgi:hypothetical protein
MTHRFINEIRRLLSFVFSSSMSTERSKSNKTRLKSSEDLRRKSSDYLFQPIVSTNDRKPPSPFQTGLRYLKFLGQIKRQNEDLSNDTHPLKSTVIDRLERTSAFSTNYYAPLPPLSPYGTNKSIQVDDFDDLSYKTAIDKDSLSSYEFFFIFMSILFFISIILFLQFNSHPLHCLLHKKFWYPMDFSNGFVCENTNIEIHYVEIDSIIYQLEIHKNSKAINCLSVDILSCLPIDYFSVPKRQIIRRNNQLIKYCNYTQKFHCQNHSLRISPYEYKWNLKNNDIHELFHCSCSRNSNHTKCFHFMLTDQCDLQIPWFDYCLKYSTTQSTCQAYVRAEEN